MDANDKIKIVPDKSKKELLEKYNKYNNLKLIAAGAITSIITEKTLPSLYEFKDSNKSYELKTEYFNKEVVAYLVTPNTMFSSHCFDRDSFSVDLVIAEASESNNPYLVNSVVIQFAFKEEKIDKKFLKELSEIFKKPLLEKRSDEIKEHDKFEILTRLGFDKIHIFSGPHSGLLDLEETPEEFFDKLFPLFISYPFDILEEKIFVKTTDCGLYRSSICDWSEDIRTYPSLTRKNIVSIIAFPLSFKEDEISYFSDNEKIVNFKFLSIPALMIFGTKYDIEEYRKKKSNNHLKTALINLKNSSNEHLSSKRYDFLSKRIFNYSRHLNRLFSSIKKTLDDIDSNE